MPNNLNDCFSICVAKGSPRLSEPGPEVASNLNELYTTCVSRQAKTPKLIHVP